MNGPDGNMQPPLDRDNFGLDEIKKTWPEKLDWTQDNSRNLWFVAPIKIGE